ncbi:MAG: polysaccharide deacetylase family protein [Lachnospiraceae bacterium]|nr:polysaccharide deacetylase family protein [Lachnospiraceae bacterium]
MARPSDRARRKRLQRRRRLRFIYATSVFIIMILVIFLVTGLIETGKKKNTKAKEEKAAQIAAEEEAIKARRNAIAEAEKIAVGYDYDGAIAYLQQQDEYDTDSELVNAIAKFTAEKSSLEAKDPLTVPHIFYHSLIVDTDRAFDESKWDSETIGGTNAWMTTVEEFDKITQQMYDNGWVLVRMRDLVTETKDEDGTVHFTKNRSLLLPEDKKPFVLSIDDWSYYHSYDGKGYGDKAVVDADGNVKIQYTDASGNVSVGDYDVIPRMNTFLEAHPDGAYKGARGLAAMTGYNGVFGYRTDVAYKTHEKLGQDQAAYLEAHPDFNYEAEIEEARKVADAVKESGWEFACHTWGHLSVTGKSVETLATDQEKWQNTVANITGPTDTIIFAHGADIGTWRDYDASTNDVYAYFKSKGYNFYANVDASGEYWVQIRDGYCRQGRIDCDGLQMWRAISGTAKKNVFEKLFDVTSVFDARRPTPVSATGKA